MHLAISATLRRQNSGVLEPLVSWTYLSVAYAQLIRTNGAQDGGAQICSRMSGHDDFLILAATVVLPDA